MEKMDQYHSAETDGCERRAISIRTVARRLGLSLSATYAAVARGEIPARRIGGRVIVAERFVDRLLSEIEQHDPPSTDGDTESRAA